MSGYLVVKVADNVPGTIYDCETWDQAVDVAVNVVTDAQAPDDEATVRQQLELDGFYAPSKYPEWTVNICQSEAPPTKKGRKRK